MASPRRCQIRAALVCVARAAEAGHGGSGARIQVVESLAQVEAIFAADPSVSLPDNFFLLQEDLYVRRRRLTKWEATSD